VVCTLDHYLYAESDGPVETRELIFPLDPPSGIGDTQEEEFAEDLGAMVVHQVLDDEMELFVYTGGLGDDGDGVVHSAVVSHTIDELAPGQEILTVGAERQNGEAASNLTVACVGA
jgi:hypothetical protein